MATESGVKGRSTMEASKGKSNSGIWSNPVNLLLQTAKPALHKA